MIKELLGEAKGVCPSGVNYGCAGHAASHGGGNEIVTEHPKMKLTVEIPSRPQNWEVDEDGVLSLWRYNSEAAWVCVIRAKVVTR